MTQTGGSLALTDPTPNAPAAREFLDAAFAPVEDAHPGALIEIAYCWPGKDAITRARYFPNTAEGRAAAAEFGAATSCDGTNVYFAPSLRKPDTLERRTNERGEHQRARKEDVLGAPMVWLDFDDPGAAEEGTRQWRKQGNPPNRVVVTGRHPETRAQAFWFLDGIVSDQAELDTLLAGAHVKFGFVADPKVINADRVMRLAGTLSHPKAGKEGRRLECTTLHKPAGAPDAPHAIDSVSTMFPPRDAKAARKGEDAPPGGHDLLSAPAPAGAPAPTTPAPAASLPTAPPAAPPQPAAPGREFDMLGRRVDGRDEYAMQIIGGAIRNLAAALGRWPTGAEIGADAWPTYANHCAPKRPIAGEPLEAGLEREGRGWTWFSEKCETHARRAADGAIAGMETVEKAAAAAQARQAAMADASGVPGAFTAGPMPLAPRVAAVPIPEFRKGGLRLTGGKGVKPRKWLYGRHLIRGYVSATISPGGVGKSSLTGVEALAMATGQPLLGVPLAEPLRVWIWNGEDPHDETARRVEAAALHFKIADSMLGGRLHIDSGRDSPVKIAVDTRDGPEVVEHVKAAIRDKIKADGIDVLIVDPFISCHAVPENDNSAIETVVRAFADIAKECDCAVELVHHSRKQANGYSGATTVEDGRGAGALLAAVRSARALNRMTEKEAETFKIGMREQWAYFRVDNGKSNLSPPAEVAEWRRMESVELPNGTESEPGDSVGVATKWTPPSAFEGVTREHVRAVQDAVHEALVAGDPYRRDKQGTPWIGRLVADVIGLDLEEGADERRAKSIIKTWLENDVLRVDTVTTHGHRRPVIVAGARAE